MDNLLKLRKSIDECDRDLVAVLSKRFALVKKVALYKKEKKLKPLDAARWREVLRKIINISKKKKVSEKLIREIANSIHKESLKIEEDVISGGSKYAKK